MKKNRFLLAATLVLLASLLSACSDAEFEFMAEILVDWMKAGDILSAEDQINVAGIFTAMAVDTAKALKQDEEPESLEWYPQVFDNIVDAYPAALRPW